ncbi:pyridoxal-phosphate dependent enzyme [Salinithrix halophila]|uniref:Pyridoxal-phosphate dependent enzyme n=1 Tax=Salinithrix halophila TaxID=1485204 RepID=A0ABV8J8U0_9BACL
MDYRSMLPWDRDGKKPGMMRYGNRLPYTIFPTLGEGNTPLLELPRLADKLGISSFRMKDEGQNPTGSHKDRFSPLVIARALETDARVLVTASSGNAGLSVTSYAAFAGLDCVVISQENLNKGLQKAIQGTGAKLLLMNQPHERWELMHRFVEEEGYFPVTNYINPPVGSHPCGVQGYKTIAYEIYEQSGNRAPDAVLVPTSRGDLLWGIKEGFDELSRIGLIQRIPRLVAIEPIPRLSEVLVGEDWRKEFTDGHTPLLSIGGNTVAWQAVSALQETEGSAVVVGAEEASAAQEELEQHGLYLELSSATILAAARQLIQKRWIKPEEYVIAVGTSHGWKL